MVFDFGLTPQQRMIVRHARSRCLPGAERCQIIPPLWSIALLTLLTLLALMVLMIPGRSLMLLLVPAMGLWQRRRAAQRIEAWADALLDR